MIAVDSTGEQYCVTACREPDSECMGVSHYSVYYDIHVVYIRVYFIASHRITTGMYRIQYGVSLYMMYIIKIAQQPQTRLA